MERVLSEFFCPITWSAGRERRRRRQKSMKAPTWGAERERESSKRRCPKSKSRSLMSETRRRASTRCALLFLNNSRVRSWAYAHYLMFSEAADKLDLPFFQPFTSWMVFDFEFGPRDFVERERERVRIKGFCARAYAQSCTCSTLHIGWPPHLTI